MKDTENIVSTEDDAPEALEYYKVVDNMLPKEHVDDTELVEALCTMAKNTYELLQGSDHHGWWNDINYQKKVRLAVRE